MKLNRNNPKKLSILGFCAGNTPLVIEMAKDSLSIDSFDIIKNVEVDIPDNLLNSKYSGIRVYESSQYHFDTHEPGIQFGVLDAHIKYILYQSFLKDHGLEKSRFTDIIHPTSYLANSSIYGKGFILDPLSVVTSGCRIGFGVTIKRSSSVGHHVTIGDFVTINPGATISGNVKIGEGTTIGAGATIIHNINIGRYSIIGAGSVVTKDIPEGVVAYGNPCRVVRKYERWQKAFDMAGRNADVDSE